MSEYQMLMSAKRGALLVQRNNVTPRSPKGYQCQRRASAYQLMLKYLAASYPQVSTSALVSGNFSLPFDTEEKSEGNKIFEVLEIPTRDPLLVMLLPPSRNNPEVRMTAA